MCFADGRAAIGEILVAVEKPAAIQHVIEWRRNKAGLILIAEATEERIVQRKGVVDSNVEIVARFGAYRNGYVIEARVVRIRRRQQRGKMRGQGVDGSGSKNVGWNSTAVHGDGYTAQAAGIRRSRGPHKGLARIEQLTDEGRSPATIQRHRTVGIARHGVDGHRWSIGQQLREIAHGLALVRDGGRLW